MTIGPAFDDVLAAARAGSSWAIAVLYRELQPALVRYLDARSAGEGEDLASEVWLSAAPKLADFHGDEAGFRSWMFTIAHRRAVDHARKTIRRRTEPVDGEQFDRRAAPNDPAAETVRDLTARQAIAALTDSLPADQAEVLRLRVVAGFDVAEVSRIMGRSPGAVRVLQHRALRRLARRLGPLSDQAVTG